MKFLKSIYFWFLIIVILIAIGVTFVVQDEIINEQETIKRRLEIKNSNIVGYENGIPSFKIQANYIWAGRSLYIFEGEALKKGRLYDSKGKLVIDNISADRIRVNTKRNILAAFDNIQATFFQRSESPKSITIHADELRYFSENKRTYLYKNIQLIRDKTTIYPNNQVDIDNETNIAYLNYGFKLNSDELIASANTMTIFLDEQYAEINGNIHFIRLAENIEQDNIDNREEKIRQKSTDLKCDYLKYHNQDDNEKITIKGNIKLLQDGKYITADYGYYDKNQKFYELKDNIVIKTSSLRWLINKPPTSFENKDLRDSLNVAVEIKGNHLTFDSEEKELTLIGNVKVVLTDKVISCQKLIFNDKNDWVELIGNVVMVKENHDKLMSSFISLNINDESVIARKRVVTKFKVK